MFQTSTNYLSTTLVIFAENGEFYPGYPGYNDYFPGQGDPNGMNFLPPTSGPGNALVDQNVHPAGKLFPLLISKQILQQNRKKHHQIGGNLYTSYTAKCCGKIQFTESFTNIDLN